MREVYVSGAAGGEFGAVDQPGLQVGDHRGRPCFLDPGAREYYADWETVAQDAVALLRKASAEYADDTELAALVDELRPASPEFERFWTSQDVQNRSHCPKILNHPVAGQLTFSLESLQLPGDDGQFVITYTPSDDTTKARLATVLVRDHSPLRES
ncbi:hypothetical protein EV651_108131 [Kribbella sp. VKM Ac-2571]|uniref:MmyB family transcriptional regulator n=1 Tax=Kribbella sp. VKM Ac-2571 TaxID=2512222 RepID=UPI00106102C8|nr:hypothetical protein [Kribbella sp. VKM Ac-2571]TDO59787.1 hypothetical protein EV651_108131 [Kribbella sp. VKM Ac-2571]